MDEKSEIKYNVWYNEIIRGWRKHNSAPLSYVDACNLALTLRTDGLRGVHILPETEKPKPDTKKM